MEESQGPRLPKISKRIDPQARTPRKTFKSLVLLGSMVLAVFFLIFWGVGWMASEDSTPDELFARVQDGTRQNQRIAALLWSQKLQDATLRKNESVLTLYSPNVSHTERLSSVLKNRIEMYYARSSSEDLLYLGSLIQILSFSRVPQLSWATFKELLLDARRESLPSELRVQLLLGLSRMASYLEVSRTAPDAALTEALIRESRSNESALRKAASYAFGLLYGAKSSSLRELVRLRLHELLNDDVGDVRWNAAFALGRWADDVSLKPVLEELIRLAQDVQKTGKIEGDDSMVLTEALLETLDQSFRLTVRLGSKEGFEVLADPLQKIAVISREHPHLKIRQAALAALKSRD
jgi:hypothetical protein